MHLLGRVRLFTLAIASLATSAPMFAQMPAYMHALAMPPANVGTCMPARTSTDRGSVGRVERHLVIVTADPAARREMFLFAKPGGEVTYSEYLIITHVTSASVSSRVGSGFGIGSNVLAAYAPKSGWSGRFFADTIHTSLALHPGGKTEKLPLVLMILTADEVAYFKNGGILSYVLRNLVAA